MAYRFSDGKASAASFAQKSGTMSIAVPIAAASLVRSDCGGGSAGGNEARVSLCP